MEKRYMILESKLCKELELLEEKYRTGAEMSEGDLRKIDLLSHALKSLCAYTTMKSSEQGYDYGNSYAGNSYNGNSYMGNSYIANSYDNLRGMRSRDMGPNMSGHMPYPYMPNNEPRW